MELSENIKTVCNEVVQNYKPEKIILYNAKRNVDGEIRSFKICVIVDTVNRLEMEEKIYLNIDSEIPFDVLVYTPEEWEKTHRRKQQFRLPHHQGGDLYLWIADDVKETTTAAVITTGLNAQTKILSLPNCFSIQKIHSTPPHFTASSALRRH